MALAARARCVVDAARRRGAGPTRCSTRGALVGRRRPTRDAGTPPTKRARLRRAGRADAAAVAARPRRPRCSPRERRRRRAARDARARRCGTAAPAVRRRATVADAGLGARDAGAVRADRASASGCGSCRRGTSRPIPARSISCSIPALAFGTGSASDDAAVPRVARRATCAPATSVLDYGCGSGILAIAAAQARRARASSASTSTRRRCDAARDNARANDVDARRASTPRRAARDERFDIVVANILANPLVLLAPALAARPRAGGRIALVGHPRGAGRRGRSPPTRRWFTSRRCAGDDGWVRSSACRAPTGDHPARRACTRPAESDDDENSPAARAVATVFRVTAGAARAARRAGALRPLPDGVRRQRAADLARAAPREADGRRRRAAAADGHAAQRRARWSRCGEPAPAATTRDAWPSRRRRAMPRPSRADARDEPSTTTAGRAGPPREQQAAARRSPRRGPAAAVAAARRAGVCSTSATRWPRTGPATRPLLARLCELAGCAVRPLRDIGGLSIEASDLQADPAHRGLLILTATLRNRAA